MRVKKSKPDTRLRNTRGGSWLHPTADYVRAAICYEFTPLDRYGLIGFRLMQRGCRRKVLKVTP